MFELDSSRFYVVRECVVQPLPFFKEVKVLENFKPADLVKSYDSTLVKRYEKFASRARLSELNGAQFSISKLDELRAKHEV